LAPLAWGCATGYTINSRRYAFRPEKPKTIRALAVLRRCGRAIVNKAVGQFEIYFDATGQRRLAELDASRSFNKSKSASKAMRLVRGTLFERVVFGAL